jgi:signal peptidase I
MTPLDDTTPRAVVSVTQTVRAVLLTPRVFFSAMPAGGAGRAVEITLLVSAVAGPIAALGMRLLGPVATTDVLRAIFTAPLSALVGIYFLAGIVYVLGRIFRGPGPMPFGTVVACLAYAQLATALSVVPVVGTIAAWLYGLWLTAVAVRLALHRSWLFAWGVVVGPPVVAVVVALGLRTFVVEAFKIPSPGMWPTLAVGDRIFVGKSAYGWGRRIPDRGDAVVFPFPEKPDQDFIQRVVGLPGDRITVEAGALHINGWKVPTCVAGRADVVWLESRHRGDLVVEFLGDRAYLVFHDAALEHGPDDVEGPYVVAPGEVFVLGDNRENSHDSRFWFGGKGGGVPKTLLVGAVRNTDKVELPKGAESLKSAFDVCNQTLNAASF